MTRKGADIASYQGNVDFDALRSEVSFVICKATEGVGYTDHTFARNWSEAKRVGLVRGAYHFARPDLGNSADEEAAYFLSALGPLDPTDLLALDYEVQWGGDVVGWCKAWLDSVKAMTSIVPFIYLNLFLARSKDWTPVISAGYPLWLADYDQDPLLVPQTPWPTVAMKQWTSSGTLAGVQAARVDLDTWFGGGDMTSDEVKQIVKDYIANEYGPALEDELRERLKGAVAASVKAVADKLSS